MAIAYEITTVVSPSFVTKFKHSFHFHLVTYNTGFTSQKYYTSFTFTPLPQDDAGAACIHIFVAVVIFIGCLITGPRYRISGYNKTHGTSSYVVSFLI